MQGFYPPLAKSEKMRANSKNLFLTSFLATPLLIFCLTFLPFAALTANSSPSELRKTFVEAERLLKKKRLSAWYKLKPTLKEYPLYPYLLMREIRADSSSFSNTEISEYIEKWEVPVSGYFFSWWLSRLHAQKDWSLVAKHFAKARDTKTRCRYAYALYKSKQFEKAYPNLEKLWLYKRSRPDACDPLFQFGLKNGIIDDRLVFKRMLLTQARRNRGLTNYLQTLLRSKNAKQWGHELAKAHKNPRDELTEHFLKWIQSEFGRDLIEYAFVRIARRDLNESIQVWKKLKNQHPAAFSKLAAVQKTLAIRFALYHHEDAYRWLSTLPTDLQDRKALRLQVRSALASESWQHVLDTIDLMDEEEASGSEWIFWRARALHEVGQTEIADELWRSIASELNFYGFLAADRLGLDYALSEAAESLSQEEITEVTAKVPGFLRIREWLALNRMFSARRELVNMKNTQNDTFWQAAAEMFHLWNWHDGAVRATFQIEQPSKVSLSVFYPIPYIKTVRKEAKRYDVPAHWIYGIMRQESLFIADIRSSAGAIGLMQLLPSTARMTAKRHGLSKPSKAQLTRASLNVRLGTAFFKQLLNRMDGNPVHALAGYNAGPSRSFAWQKRFRASDPAIWVETIPFRETRIYVKKVLANFIIYDSLFNGKSARIRNYLEVADVQQAYSSGEY